MRFIWPEMLWLLLAAPALVAAYVVLLRRRKKAAVRFTNVALVRAAMGPGAFIRRHLPPMLFLLAIITVIVGIARPQTRMTLPSMHQTVILAVDVSLSMGAEDVDPNRITAAQAAAKAFIEERPADLRVGLVAFGGNAILVQPPTTNREDLLAAIDRFELQRGTATGSALYASLAALLPDSGIDLQSLEIKWESMRNPRDASQFARARPAMTQAAPVAPGSYASGAIILMSDGFKTVGPEPLDAARVVSERGVRVFTVGFGTKEGGMVRGDGWSIFVRLDEKTLQAIADMTRGAYFHASTADDLKKVYRSLNSRLVMERKDVEITFIFIAAGAALLLASLVLSAVWSGPLARR
jgi:Ca-activated chloride channel family protein